MKAQRHILLRTRGGTPSEPFTLLMGRKDRENSSQMREKQALWKESTQWIDKESNKLNHTDNIHQHAKFNTSIIPKVDAVFILRGKSTEKTLSHLLRCGAAVRVISSGSEEREFEPHSGSDEVTLFQSSVYHHYGDSYDGGRINL